MTATDDRTAAELELALLFYSDPEAYQAALVAKEDEEQARQIILRDEEEAHRLLALEEENDRLVASQPNAEVYEPPPDDEPINTGRHSTRLPRGTEQGDGEEYVQGEASDDYGPLTGKLEMRYPRGRKHDDASRRQTMDETFTESIAAVRESVYTPTQGAIHAITPGEEREHGMKGYDAPGVQPALSAADMATLGPHQTKVIALERMGFTLAEFEALSRPGNHRDARALRGRFDAEVLRIHEAGGTMSVLAVALGIPVKEGYSKRLAGCLKRARGAAALYGEGNA